MNRRSSSILLVLLLWCAGLGAAAQFAKIAVPFSTVQNVYPNVGNELGWLLSLVSLMGAALGIVAGGLVASAGPRKILLLGLVLGAVVSIWQSILPSFSFMLISRIVEGISHLAIVVAAPTLISQVSSDAFRGFAMALWSTFFGVSFALVAWFGVPIISLGGLEALFVGHGIFMLVIAGLLSVLLRAEDLEGTSQHSANLRTLCESHIQAYRSASISAPGFGWLFYTVTFVSLLALLPQMVAEQAQTWVAGSMPLASIAGSLLIVPILFRFMTSISMVILGFALGIAVVSCGLAGVPLAIVGVVLFLALGLVQGASFSAIPELNESVEAQALGYGVMAQMGNVGNLTGTPLLLAVLEFGGQRAMLLLVAVLYVAAILAHIFMKRRRMRGRSTGSA